MRRSFTEDMNSKPSRRFTETETTSDQKAVHGFLNSKWLVCYWDGGIANRLSTMVSDDNKFA